MMGSVLVGDQIGKSYILKLIYNLKCIMWIDRCIIILVMVLPLLLMNILTSLFRPLLQMVNYGNSRMESLFLHCADIWDHRFGREGFRETQKIVKRDKHEGERMTSLSLSSISSLSMMWEYLRYVVFDVPQPSVPFEMRYLSIVRSIPTLPHTVIVSDLSSTVAILYYF